MACQSSLLRIAYIASFVAFLQFSIDIYDFMQYNAIITAMFAIFATGNGVALRNDASLITKYFTEERGKA